MTTISFFPACETTTQLRDILSRAAWHLVHFQIARLIIPVGSSDIISAEWQVADEMDPAIKANFAALKEIVDFVVVTTPHDMETSLRASSMILRWRRDAPELADAEQFGAWTKGKEIWEVDPCKVRMEGSYYIEVGLALTTNKEALISESRKRFEALSVRLGKFERAYLFATGPSIERYRLFNYSNAITIVCNSVILDEALMNRVKPRLLVFADPIFHFGPSQYAGVFRERLLESCQRHDYTICIPFKYFALFTAALPELRERTIAIPFQKRDVFNFDLVGDFAVKTTANILTLLMMPLAAHFADEVCILGCDGRPQSENTYFWGHNPRTQINDKMANIREAHPGFFNISYDDYYSEHCETLEAQFAEAERCDKRIINLGHSYIPALSSRTGVGTRCSAGSYAMPIRRVFIIDPDAKGFIGHYMAYNDKLSNQLKSLGIDVSVVCRADIDKSILASRNNYHPVLTAHSWEVAEHPEFDDFGLDFKEQIKFFLDCEYSKSSDPALIYLYTGSTEHAYLLSSLICKYDNLHVNVNLFYSSFSFNCECAIGWSEYFNIWDQQVGAGRFVVTLPTTELRNELAEHTGCILPVALHPSTGVSDAQFHELENLNNGKRDCEQGVCVLFPSAPRHEKGYWTTLECVLNIGNIPGWRPIVRFASYPSGAPELPQALAEVQNCAEIVLGELSDDKFRELFTRADIVVLPYSADSFSKRTSGLLIDSIYHGVPCVVVQGTWLATVVKKYGCGVVVEAGATQLLTDAIKYIANDIDRYRLAAAKAGQDYFSKNSWKLFAKSLIAPSDPLRNKRWLEWPDLRANPDDCLGVPRDLFDREAIRSSSLKPHIRFFTFECSPHFNNVSRRIWRYAASAASSENFWYHIFKVDGGTKDRKILAGLSVMVTGSARVRVSLARFGASPYEEQAVVELLEPNVEKVIALSHVFSGQHSAIKVQLMVVALERDDTVNLSISSVYARAALLSGSNDSDTSPFSNSCAPPSELVALSEGATSAKHLAGLHFDPGTHFVQITPNQWRITGAEGNLKHWVATRAISSQTAGRTFTACLRLQVDQAMTVNVRLGGQGTSEYEGATERVTLAPEVAQSVTLSKRFEQAHTLLELQVDVVDFPCGASAVLTIDDLGINESVASICDRIGIDNVNFRMANRLFREGDFTTALGIYLWLSQQHPYPMYKTNAVMAARFSGMSWVKSPCDLDFLLTDFAQSPAAVEAGQRLRGSR